MSREFSPIQPLTSNALVREATFETANIGVQAAIDVNGIAAVKDCLEAPLQTSYEEAQATADGAGDFGLPGGLIEPAHYLNAYISSGFAKDTAVDATELAYALEDPHTDSPEAFVALKSAMKQLIADRLGDNVTQAPAKDVATRPAADLINYFEDSHSDKADAFETVKSAITQRSMDHVSDRITQLNTQTQRFLTEANDAEARVTQLLSDYKKLLQDMRK